MVLAFCILLFMVGLGVYAFRCQYLFHFFILWFCFFPLILNCVYTLDEEEYYKILTWAVYLSYVIAIREFCRNGIKEKWQRRLIISIVLLLFYYVSLSFLRGTSFVDSLKYMIGNVGFLISLSYILNKSCDVRTLFSLIRKIVLFEIILALFQPYTDLLNFQAALKEDDVMTSMVNGTFIRNNVYVEFITPLIMLLVYYDYKRSSKYLFHDFFIIVIALYEIYNSGVRTALVAVIPIFVYVFYLLLGFRFKTRKGRVFVMFFFGICIYSVYSFVNNIAEQTGVTYTKNATDSSERQAVLLSMFNDPDFAENQTTLGLSFVVLSTFPENPIIGSGKLLQGKGYGDFISKDEGNITDATLAIFLCESGVIGVIFLSFIYFIILNKLGSKGGLPSLIFWYLLLITIVDPGLFFFGNVLLVFIALKIYRNNLLEKYDYNRRPQKVLQSSI